MTVQGDSIGYVSEGENISIEVVGAEKIPIDEEKLKDLEKNHKDYAWDKESRTIKRKEPKKEKE